MHLKKGSIMRCFENSTMNLLLIYISLLFISPFILAQDEKSVPQTVKSVNLQKYTGTWYEIAKIPNSFQDHCIKNTTATYQLDEDGEIFIINRCVDEESDIGEAEGVARVVDTLSNSKLEVSFVSVLGVNLFWGDYWILGLEENYKYVVVGTPNRKYGWILARDPKISDEDYSNCEGILIKNGYDPKEFVLSIQDY